MVNNEVTYFDDIDIFYLANTLTMPELWHETHQADIRATVADIYQGTEYQTKADLFPWGDFANCCREAIRRQQQKPKPALAPDQGKLDIEGIKARTDIVAIVEGYTKLRKSGKNFTGRCPIHQDKHPSLTVYPDSQTWHCYGCNRGGDVIAFIMTTENCDFRQAAAILGSM